MSTGLLARPIYFDTRCL